jgi:hypothetical protein
VSENERLVIKSKNRPDMSMQIPKGVMFHETGSTGWGRIRRLGDYRGNKKEGDFSHLHDKFTGEEA